MSLLAKRGEDIGLVAQALRQAGHERRVLELVDVDLVDERRQPRQVHRPVAAVEVGVLQLELLQQERGEVRRAIGGDLEAHREAELALRQFALQRLAQVLDFFFVDPQVGVARDAELRIIDDLAAGEELVQMRVHDRGQQHERILGAGDFGRHARSPAAARAAP